MGKVAKMGMNHFEEIVTVAGARFLRVDNGSVYFADPQDGSVLSLYASGLRSVEDVRLALKSSREKAGEFSPLVPTDSLAF